MNNIQILFLVVFALVMLFVFLKLNRKVKLRWTIVSRERVGMASHVTYDIWDGDRFLDRVHVTKEESGQCYVQSMDTCTEMAFQRGDEVITITYVPKEKAWKVNAIGSRCTYKDFAFEKPEQVLKNFLDSEKESDERKKRRLGLY